jgi:hypothetical protein
MTTESKKELESCNRVFDVTRPYNPSLVSQCIVQIYRLREKR